MTPKKIGFYPRATLGFAHKSDTNLIAFARNVVAMMTKNRSYPSPLPALGTITTAVDAFELKVQQALDGGRIAILSRNASRAELVSLLRQEAAYVTGNCDADVLTLMTSGFEAAKVPGPKEDPAEPGNVRLELTGKPGELRVVCDRVSNAVNYTVQISLDAEQGFENKALSTSTRVVIAGLIPGKVYWVRVCANAAAGSSAWAGPVSAMVV